MVKQIAFFVEGEENTKDKREAMQLRRSLHRVFATLDEQAQQCGIRLRFRLYKSRRPTYEKFCEAHATARSEIYPVLLVDSEDPVRSDHLDADPGRCWQHLYNRPADRWPRPAGTDDEQCQLMVQAIEAWLFADPEALREYYGQRFNTNALPRTRDVETIAKTAHLSSLEAATKDTQPGRYHKVKHLSPLLYRLDMSKVRPRAPFCNRIFVTLGEKIDEFGA